MLVLRSYLVLVSTVLVLCESAFVDTLPKCEINDGDCEKDIIQTVLRDIAKPGISELGIPPIDPIILKNVSFSILNILELTFIEGTFKGIKDCKVDKFYTNIEEEHAFMELSCDTVSIKGRYKAVASSPLIKQFLADETVHGEGNTKIKMEKLHLRFDYYFYIQKRDGEIYIKCKLDKTVYTYDIGNMHFYVDNLFLGKQDTSQMVSTLLNENWRLLMSTFGKTFMDKGMEFVYDYVHKFFDTVPTKYFISNDLSIYVKP